MTIVPVFAKVCTRIQSPCFPSRRSQFNENSIAFILLPQGVGEISHDVFISLQGMETIRTPIHQLCTVLCLNGGLDGNSGQRVLLAAGI